MWLDDAGHYWELYGSQWYYLDGSMRWQPGDPPSGLLLLEPATTVSPDERVIALAPDGTKILRGEKGDPGPIGMQGEKGDTGATGERGEKGDTGERGPIGPVGPIATAPHERLVLDGDYTVVPPADPLDGHLVLFELVAAVDCRVSLPVGARLTAGMTDGFDLGVGQTGFVGLRWSAPTGAWHVLAVTLEKEAGE